MLSLPPPGKKAKSGLDSHYITTMTRRWQLGRLLNAMALDGDGAEIGVHKGEFAIQILRHWRGRRLWLIDPWSRQDDYHDGCNASDRVMQRRFENAQRRLRMYAPRITFVRRRSDEAAHTFAPASLDFVYVDANHSYVHVQRDLSLWYERKSDRGDSSPATIISTRSQTMHTSRCHWAHSTWRS